ncbi:unannotated protein [freshwater metagenome]|uniref:Unannotated protein n=1 Tax=freshwater metagenome TaxID=449393 RepID=A0A6J7CXU7_9ZZZZ|nr:hypothetical protein [Actinomycetota bacterium]
MTSTPVNEKILALVTPMVADLQLDLYDLEFNGGILKITVDTPAGSDGGVTLDKLALITRLLNREFEHNDPIPGNYTLEVSSPGLERTLRTPAHFQREIGKTVAIRLREVLDGARRLQGVLIAADATTATIRLDDAALTERVVPLALVDRARTVFDWSPAPKPGKAPAKKPGAPRSGASTTKNAVGKLASGPSDELDFPIAHEEATA